MKNEEVKSIDGLKENGEQVERLGKCITEYLASLFSSGSLTEQQAAQTASLMCVLSDVERMGTLSVEMAECSKGPDPHHFIAGGVRLLRPAVC